MNIPAVARSCVHIIDLRTPPCKGGRLMFSPLLFFFFSTVHFRENNAGEISPPGDVFVPNILNL